MRTRILVVEDDKTQMELICDRLTKEFDVEVRTALSVDQAMQLLKTDQNFTIAILEIYLAADERGGIKIAEELRKQIPNIQIIAYSGFGGSADLPKLLFDNVVIKGFETPRKILDIVKQNVTGHNRLLETDASSLNILIDPGTAQAEDIAELFSAISTLYRMVGGPGVDFRVTDAREPILTEAAL